MALDARQKGSPLANENSDEFRETMDCVAFGFYENQY
jgi:hypothetical protein